MSVIGTIVLLLVTAGATFYGTIQLHGGGPVQFSPEVQQYVDSKLSGANNVDQELTKLAARVAEMEGKLAESERVRAQYEQLQNKSETIESMISEQRRRREEVLDVARTAELVKLRTEIATACAGVTIKRSQAPTESESNSNSADSYRRNLGIETNQQRRGYRGRGGGGGGAGAGSGNGNVQGNPQGGGYPRGFRRGQGQGQGQGQGGGQGGQTP
jgi:TolA-binding protein